MGTLCREPKAFACARRSCSVQGAAGDCAPSCETVSLQSASFPIWRQMLAQGRTRNGMHPDLADRVTSTRPSPRMTPPSDSTGKANRLLLALPVPTCATVTPVAVGTAHLHTGDHYSPAAARTVQAREMAIGNMKPIATDRAPQKPIAQCGRDRFGALWRSLAIGLKIDRTRPRPRSVLDKLFPYEICYRSRGAIGFLA
jgi:hypothetical protein